MPMGLGLGVGLGGGVIPPSGGPNPNLLLWTEEMQQATWSKTGVTVIADVGSPSWPTADQVAFAAGATVLAQTSGVAATAGATAFSDIEVTTAEVRRTVTGTFDGAVYVLSVHLSDPVGGYLIRLQLHRVGGFLMASLRNVGDNPTILVAGWKLETPDLTAYVKREGT